MAEAEASDTSPCASSHTTIFTASRASSTSPLRAAASSSSLVPIPVPVPVPISMSLSRSISGRVGLCVVGVG